MDIGWNAEAKKELDRLVRDFPQPDLKERSENARAFILQGEATDRRAEMMQSRKAQQYKRAAALSKTFREKGVPTELQLEAREMERHEEQQHAGRSGAGRGAGQAFERAAGGRAKVLERAGDRGDEGAR